MKHIKKFILLTFVVLTGFACNSDDDGNSLTEQNKANIIGTWLQTAESENGENILLDECELLFTLVFTSTQVTSTDFYGDNCAMTDTFVSNYSIDGNNISVTEEGETFTSEITTLNSTTLTIEDTEDGFVFIETYTKQ
jgi:hypothetical protein